MRKRSRPHALVFCLPSPCSKPPEQRFGYLNTQFRLDSGDQDIIRLSVDVIIMYTLIATSFSPRDLHACPLCHHGIPVKVPAPPELVEVIPERFETEIPAQRQLSHQPVSNKSPHTKQSFSKKNSPEELTTDHQSWATTTACRELQPVARGLAATMAGTAWPTVARTKACQ
jgi:hypothetical protein